MARPRYPKDYYDIPADLSIPKFLRRPYDPSVRLPDYSRVHTHVVPSHTQRSDNLTPHDRDVIAFFRRQQEPKPTPDTPPAPPKPKSQRRQIRSSLVDMKVIAQKLNISPKDARGALRTLGMTKGEAGWVFKPSEVDDIIKKIRTTLAGKTSPPAKAVRIPRTASHRRSKRNGNG